MTEKKMAEQKLLESFRAARRVSTPIVGISTPDPAATIKGIGTVLEKEKGTVPVLQWDQVKCLRGLNEAGNAMLPVLGLSDIRQTGNPVVCLEALERLGPNSVVFWHNAHRFVDNVGVMQGIWNLRDQFKKDKRTLVLLGPIMKMPLELGGDVVLLDEPLPTRAELAEILDKQHANAKLTPPIEPDRSQALDAIVGLAAYTAESVVAMSLRGKKESEDLGLAPGIDLDRCWDRKIKAIENTDGLRVWRGVEDINELKGIDNVVAFSKMLIAADAFGAIVFIDEMEKALAGGLSSYSGDSGVSKDQVGVLLSYIEDTKSLGVLYAGIAGCGKTALAKATARASGKPLILFDLGAMKGGTVGASERTIRSALKVVSATAEGSVLFLGTANQTSAFTPELNRRFRDQFFFDLMDDAGRAALWPIYGKKNALSKEQLKIPKGYDANWTGDEIRRVCERAAMFKQSVVEASRFMVPSYISAKDVIAQQRQGAAGKFLSASTPGTYQIPMDMQTLEERVIDLEH